MNCIKVYKVFIIMCRVQMVSVTQSECFNLSHKNICMKDTTGLSTSGLYSGLVDITFTVCASLLTCNLSGHASH
jgi:hypothetical protein